MIASWSPRAPSWSPHGHPECLSVVICQWFDPYKIGDCASWPHIWRPPALYRFFGEYAGPLWGDSGEVTRIYTSRDIGPKNSSRVHPEYTPSTPAVHHWLCHCRCRWRYHCRCRWRYHWQGSEESNPELRFWRPLCCPYTRP